MLEIVLGIWPGFAATLATILAVYIRLWPPEQNHNAAWISGFMFLGVTAIAATTAGQVILYEQRQDARREDRDRMNQISQVQGKMDALLVLVPSLAKGDPEQAVAAVRQFSEVQAQLAALEARTADRHLSSDQRANSLRFSEHAPKRSFRSPSQLVIRKRQGSPMTSAKPC